jgi:hypothetical protein
MAGPMVTRPGSLDARALMAAEALERFRHLGCDELFHTWSPNCGKVIENRVMCGSFSSLGENAGSLHLFLLGYPRRHSMSFRVFFRARCASMVPFSALGHF